jgi:hypothetical protein
VLAGPGARWSGVRFREARSAPTPKSAKNWSVAVFAAAFAIRLRTGRAASPSSRRICTSRTTSPKEAADRPPRNAVEAQQPRLAPGLQHRLQAPADGERAVLEHDLAQPILVGSSACADGEAVQRHRDISPLDASPSRSRANCSMLTRRRCAASSRSSDRPAAPANLGGLPLHGRRQQAVAVAEPLVERFLASTRRGAPRRSHGQADPRCSTRRSSAAVSTCLLARRERSLRCRLPTRPLPSPWIARSIIWRTPYRNVRFGSSGIVRSDAGWLRAARKREHVEPSSSLCGARLAPMPCGGWRNRHA